MYIEDKAFVIAIIACIVIFAVFIAILVYTQFFVTYDCSYCHDKGVLPVKTGFGGTTMYQDCVHCDKYDFEGLRAKGNY